MKKVGIFKRLGCLLLIFLLSIDSFASIVSDNDGSAFITKAEFDALKSSFQSQIDTYNQSIDSKIDGAIASYLSGINLVTELPRDWISTINGATANKFRWEKGLTEIGSDTCKANIRVVGTRIHKSKLLKFYVYAATTTTSGNNQFKFGLADTVSPKNVDYMICASQSGNGTGKQLSKK